MQTKPLTIALDAMGGDFGPQTVIPGAALALEQNPELHFILYGDEGRIHPVLSQHQELKAVSTVFHTDKYISGHDKPSAALRNGKGSSMRMAIEAVQEGKAQAVVSGGNTGALMAMAMVVLKTLPGVRRPALASVFPTVLGEATVMLDLGANVLVDAEHLVHFAVMGSVFAKVYKGKVRPSVGLLNVGTEESKGPEHVRAASAILSGIQFPGDYKGFVEGTDITAATVDVVVCDGYAGNIALKAAEGVGKMSVQFFREALNSSPLAMLGGMLAYFALKKFKKRIDPRLYNGGVFLGLDGLCIKSHGGSDALGFSSAVLLAVRLARQDYVTQVAEEIQNLLHQETFLAKTVMEG